MDEAKIKEVFSDGAFVKELLEMDTPEEVRSALKGKGIDMTEDEVIRLRDEIIKATEKADANGELSLDALDEAAGGGLTVGFAAFCAVAAVGIPAVAGVAGGAATLGVMGISSLISNRRW